MLELLQHAALCVEQTRVVGRNADGVDDDHQSGVYEKALVLCTVAVDAQVGGQPPLRARATLVAVLGVELAARKGHEDSRRDRGIDQEDHEEVEDLIPPLIILMSMIVDMRLLDLMKGLINFLHVLQDEKDDSYLECNRRMRSALILMDPSVKSKMGSYTLVILPHLVVAVIIEQVVERVIFVVTIMEMMIMSMRIQR